VNFRLHRNHAKSLLSLQIYIFAPLGFMYTLTLSPGPFKKTLMGF
jgi:hypothetical protein